MECIAQEINDLIIFFARYRQLNCETTTLQIVRCSTYNGTSRWRYPTNDYSIFYAKRNYSLLHC